MKEWKLEYRKLWLKNPSKIKDIELFIENLLVEATLTDKPEELRKGQNIFNFLEWLKVQDYPTNQSFRLADPFYISDEEYDGLYKAYLKDVRESY